MQNKKIDETDKDYHERIGAASLFEAKIIELLQKIEENTRKE